MMLDRMLSARRVEERIDGTTNERHRKMLQVLHAHLIAEADLNLDGLMATLVDEPEYHMWGSGRDTGPKGRDAVARYYTDLVAARRGVLEYDIERIVVDDDTIVTEGFIRAYQHGPVAAEFGYAVPELDAHYIVRYRALVLWPFDDDGRLLGEDGYGGVDQTDFVRVETADLSDEYRSLFPELDGVS